MSWGEAEVQPKVSRQHCSSLERRPSLSLVSAAGPSPLATFGGAARERAERGRLTASSTSSISELLMASCSNGKMASSWFLCFGDKMQFSGSPVAGNRKAIILLLMKKNTYEDTCKFLKTGSLRGWKARCFKAQEARYRGINSKMSCIRSPDTFENCSYQIEIRSQREWIVSPRFRKLQITSDSLIFH